MTVQRGVEVWLCFFFNLGGRTTWVVSAKLPSTTGKTRHPLCRRLGGPQSGLDGCGKSRHPPGFDTRTIQPVASSYTDWAIPAHNRNCKEGKNTYIQGLILNWNKRNTVIGVKVAPKNLTAVFPNLLYFKGDRGGTVVKVLCYKSEGRWFIPRWFHWNFWLT